VTGVARGIRGRVGGSLPTAGGATSREHRPDRGRLRVGAHGMPTYVLMVAVACAAMGGGASAMPAADAVSPAEVARPDATLRLSEGRLSTGLAYMWGRGRLSFQDQRHEFRISGPPVADVQALNLSATGKVYHLARLSDFSGSYVAVDAASVPAAESDAVPLKNEHGVVIMLRVAAAGTQPGRAAGAVHIQLSE
jgi:hypothetical protein